MGFLAPKAPKMPDPVETARAQAKAQQEIEDEKAVAAAEEAAKAEATAFKRSAAKRASRSRLIRTSLLGPEQDFVGTQRSMLD
jgi:hypothetical protein